MDQEALLSLTSDIVSAHVSNNRVAASDLPRVIEAVFGALSQAGQPEVVAEAPREPAVSVRSSVKSGAITCLECGRKLKMLKRHLSTDHGLTPGEYRARWKLGADYPLIAPDYAATRKALAIRIGLGRKSGEKRKPAVVKKPRARKAFQSR